VKSVPEKKSRFATDAVSVELTVKARTIKADGADVSLLKINVFQPAFV
jgi:hypothetical protein